MRTTADDRRWMDHGTALFLDTVAALDEAGLEADSGLPGWTRKHVVAHVAANADAVGHLVQWAATGVERPMYGSPEERTAGIEQGAALPAPALLAWLRRSTEALAEAMDQLTDAQWASEVRTAQGRTVPATETPWMRAREVCVHAVDLDAGLTFADLPDDFNRALCDDIRAKRAMAELPTAVADAPLAEVTAWLSGRPHTLAGAPALGPWL
jgi:maleylpyruvate isomerase